MTQDFQPKRGDLVLFSNDEDFNFEAMCLFCRYDAHSDHPWIAMDDHGKPQCGFRYARPVIKENNRMSDAQEQHLQSIKDRFCALIDAKYRAGAREHQGNLWELPTDQLHKEITNEILDLVAYQFTLDMLR